MGLRSTKTMTFLFSRVGSHTVDVKPREPAPVAGTSGFSSRTASDQNSEDNR